MTFCCLCGHEIPAKPLHKSDARDMDHVPAKQFFPETIRVTLRKQLWKVPTHKKCNQQAKNDEEYFYHYLYPLVGFQNAAMGEVVLDDLRRRAAKPQTKGIIRRILKEMTHQSPGGIILPPTLVRVNYDLKRIQNVVVKIAKGLFYQEYGRYLPRENCEHIEMCERVTDLQPIFSDLWRVKELERDSAVPSVFRYWHVEVDDQHYYSMLFWEAFMFCTIFRDPAVPEAADAC